MVVTLCSLCVFAPLPCFIFSHLRSFSAQRAAAPQVESHRANRNLDKRVDKGPRSEKLLTMATTTCSDHRAVGARQGVPVRMSIGDRHRAVAPPSWRHCSRAGKMPALRRRRHSQAAKAFAFESDANAMLSWFFATASVYFLPDFYFVCPRPGAALLELFDQCRTFTQVVHIGFLVREQVPEDEPAPGSECV